MAYNPEKTFARMLEIAIKENPLAYLMAADQLLNQAAEGKAWAIKELADRRDGKAVQQINVDKEERIKLIAVVPEKSATTEDWLKLIGEQKEGVVNAASRPGLPTLIEGKAEEIEE